MHPNTVQLLSVTMTASNGLRQSLENNCVFRFTEQRDMAVLQLFFSEFMSENDLVALAHNQGGLYRERLATYQSIADAAGEKRIKRRRMASVHLGIRMMKACIDFWDEVAKSPPGP